MAELLQHILNGLIIGGETVAGAGTYDIVFTLPGWEIVSQEGVIVRPGARVRAGQLLARSGNTGLSSGPHLHFVIQQNTGMKLISLPFEFRLADGSTATPEEGRYIGALPALP